MGSFHEWMHSTRSPLIRGVTRLNFALLIFRTTEIPFALRQSISTGSMRSLLRCPRVTDRQSSRIVSRSVGDKKIGQSFDTASAQAFAEISRNLSQHDGFAFGFALGEYVAKTIAL